MPRCIYMAPSRSETLYISAHMRSWTSMFSNKKQTFINRRQRHCFAAMHSKQPHAHAKKKHRAKIAKFFCQVKRDERQNLLTIIQYSATYEKENAKNVSDITDCSKTPHERRPVTNKLSSSRFNEPELSRMWPSCHPGRDCKSLITLSVPKYSCPTTAPKKTMKHKDVFWSEEVVEMFDAHNSRSDSLQLPVSCLEFFLSANNYKTWCFMWGHRRGKVRARREASEYIHNGRALKSEWSENSHRWVRIVN